MAPRRKSGKSKKGSSTATSAQSTHSRSSTRPRRPYPRHVARGGSRTSSIRSSITKPTHSIQTLPANTSSSHASTSAQDDAEETTLEEIVLALDVRERGIIGCSYYVARDETLYFMEDIHLGSNELVDQLKVFISPTAVLLSTRALDETVRCFDPHFNSVPGDQASDPLNLPFTLEFRPPSEFGYDAAKAKLINLQIGAYGGPNVNLVMPGDEDFENDLEGVGHQARMMKLSALISTDGRITVGCAGAVLAYLQRRRSTAFLPSDPAANELFRISCVSMFALKDYMFVNMDTILSLQIMQSESHPSSHNQGPAKTSSGSKEGLSVYGLFQNLARSPQGKFALKQLFLRPILNSDRINERLDAISVFSRPENNTILDTLRDHMSNINNVRSFVLTLRRGACGGSGKTGKVASKIWSGLQKFTYHCIQIYKSLNEILGIEDLKISHSFVERVSLQDITSVSRYISEIIDFEQSNEQRRTAVRQGVDPDLDKCKHTYQGIEEFLAMVADHIRREIPVGLPQDIKVVYLPQIGFLVALPKDEEAGTALFEGVEHEPWEKMFSGDNIVYYKNDKMKDMDDYFGDLYTDICDREIEIIHELALQILRFEEALTSASDACAELDCLLALAEGAKRYNLSRPRLTQRNTVQIEAGRHLLQELAVPSFIPNDTALVASIDDASVSSSRSPTTSKSSYTDFSQSGTSMLILTGPNFSGKSVYLKQVAIIVYMAHIGSFVPAARATVGITDKILLRVATRESVSRSQSAFLVDLQQVSKALNLATSRSLLIIDEFGKGTTSSDGAGLAASLLEHLSNLENTKRPKVIAATHFHEIFESHIIQSSIHMSFAYMEIRLDDNSDDTRHQVTYLYNLRAGISSASFGTVCAAINGIGDKIVRRAEQLALLATRGEDLVAACATLSKDESQELAAAERGAREFLARDVQSDPQGLLNDVLQVPIHG